MLQTQLDYENLLDEVDHTLAEVFSPEERQDTLAAVMAVTDLDERVLLLRDLMVDLSNTLEGSDTTALATRDRYKWRPVGVREFITSKQFMDKEKEVYPPVLDEIEKMNSGAYYEAVLTGGIGSGKTTAALYTNAYQLYLLSCLYNPHSMYGDLDPASEILFVFQSITATLAAGVDYSRFRAMLETSPYFKEHFPFDRKLLSKMVFPNRIEVKPISGADTAAIGQNVMGGLIDELNYMSVVEKSTKNVDKGAYDQAIALYNSISRRRKSRFMEQGKVPGILCLVSSKKYPGQFTDQKEAEAKQEITETGKTGIYIYDKRIWDIKPHSFTGEIFKMFIGDNSRKPRILTEEDVIKPDDQRLVMNIPLEYKPDFRRDPMGSLRDIAGVSTLALFPYFQSREDVAEMFDPNQASILSQTVTDFISPKLSILPKRFWKPDIPRWIHIDLSKIRDATGVSCGCCPGFAATGRGEDDYEMLPQIRYDFQLQVVPPPGGEILFHKIRSLIYSLKEMGLNIKWVSFDSFQSVDMQQILRQQGYITGEISMDKSTLPYEILKTACYDHRVSAPLHTTCEIELIGLEMNPKDGKIDHRPTGSKDVSDSMAGVAYGITMRRETWLMYDIPIVKMPGEFQELLEKERERMKEEGDYEALMGMSKANFKE
jgi:hypothetical protein